MTKLLQRYNVGPRLAAAFAVLIVLSGLIAFIGYRGLSASRALVDHLVNQNMVKIRLSNTMMNANSVIATQIRNVVLPTSNEDNLKFIENIKNARDVPPILSSTSVWSPIPYPKEIGREEAFYRRAD
ncbi:MCP four helix bundle domain-containing protein, partial [Xanthomonas citri]|uniref:MCP four helix bundle domain-containing protein n=1 Tax=Xanthomonas citri TaxID=346 RepID=UPI001E3BD86A